MDKQPVTRIVPIAAITGAILLFIGTYLHPMEADPNQASAAFTEYAAARHWIASHLTQLFGVMLMVIALVLLSRRIVHGLAAEWAALARIGAIASLAMASALQAIDGVALKAMVDIWAETPEPGKSVLFHAVLAVRQIERGFASITGLLFGLTISIYSIAILIDRRFPKWIGAVGIAGGIATGVAGVVIAYTGFSELAMAINLPSSLLLMLWMIALAIYTWRQPDL
jgi:hypothetical protein